MLVETKVGTLFVEARGRGPDIVLWHSFLCDGDMWREQTTELRQHFRFINIDAPGHGRSARSDHPYTMDDCVSATLQVMDALEISRAAFCGLSWGGMVFMRLAARYPERVIAAALLNTSARAERPAKKLGYRLLALVATHLGPARPLLRVIRPLFFAPRTLRERPDLIERFDAHVLSLDPRSLGYSANAVMFDRGDCTPELSKIQAPVCVVVGDHDRATPPLEGEWIARHVRDGQLVRVPEAGHLSPLENPTFVNSQLVQFFERHCQRAFAPAPIRA